NPKSELSMLRPLPTRENASEVSSLLTTTPTRRDVRWEFRFSEPKFCETLGAWPIWSTTLRSLPTRFLKPDPFSKQFTSAAVLLLSEQGKLSLSEPIRK